ncbi:MAG: flavodoxin family protein [Lentihominibacter sp.]
MYTLVLTASPRPEGNTYSLVKVFAEELQRQAARDEQKAGDSRDEHIRVKIINLYNLDIKPCTACRSCQGDANNPGCVIDDGMQMLFPEIMKADLIVLASPVYSWYCTPPMKAFLDRCVYAMNKFYGTPPAGACLWQDKRVALITTCGYPPEKGADLLEAGIKRYCTHSRLKYEGMLAERHLGYDIPFMDDAKAKRAEEFAKSLLSGEEHTLPKSAK